MPHTEAPSRSESRGHERVARLSSSSRTPAQLPSCLLNQAAWEESKGGKAAQTLHCRSHLRLLSSPRLITTLSLSLSLSRGPHTSPSPSQAPHLPTLCPPPPMPRHPTLPPPPPPPPPLARAPLLLA
eukprot:3069766-Rhodomonas_salina.1